eukprot:PhF_6_TR7190/c0_g1_i1/m.10744
MSNISVVVPDEVIGGFASILGQMIVINAAFSFSSDVVAQLLEGKRCCGETRKVEEVHEDETIPPVPGTTEGQKTAPDLAKPDEAAPAPAPTPAPTTTTETPAEGAQPAPPPGEGGLHIEKPAEGTEGSPEGEEGKIEPLPEPFDWPRAFKFAFTGVIFCGVVQFIRLEFIDVIFPRKGEQTLTMAIYKTVFNQLIFSPIVRVASMSTIQYMKTRDCNDVKLKLKNDFFEAQAVSYAVKPIGNFLAFWIFPHNLVGQAVMIRSVAFVYNVYFSYKANREVHSVGQNVKDAPEGHTPVTLSDAEAVLSRERAPDGAVAGAREPQAPITFCEAETLGGERPTPQTSESEAAAKKKEQETANKAACACCVIC